MNRLKFSTLFLLAAAFWLAGCSFAAGQGLGLAVDRYITGVPGDLNIGRWPAFDTYAPSPHMIVVGTFANARWNPDTGKGDTDLHIEAVVKPHPILKGRKIISIPRYFPIKDPKKPPRYILFCDVTNNEIDPYSGWPCESKEDVIKYTKEAIALKNKKEPQRLRFFLRHLLHKDEYVARDAFAQIVNLDYAVFRQLAKEVKADDIADLLKKHNPDSSIQSLLGFLLGHAGDRRHEKLLRQKIEASEKNKSKGLTGLLIGYTLLDPKAGYKHICKNIKDDSELQRWAYTRNALLFFENHRTDVISEKQLTEATCLALKGQYADVAAADLLDRRCIEGVERVLALWKGKRPQETSILRRLTRYALSMPDTMPALHFLQELRRAEPDFISEIEEMLKLENQP